MDERGGGRSRSSHPSRPWPLLGASLCRPGPGGGGWSLRMPGAPPVPRPQLRLPGVSPPLSPPLGLPVGGSPSRPGPLKWSPARPAGLPTSSSKTRDTAPGGGGHVGPGAWVEWGEGPEARGRWGSWCGQRASPSSPHPRILTLSPGEQAVHSGLFPEHLLCARRQAEGFRPGWASPSLSANPAQAGPRLPHTHPARSPRVGESRRPGGFCSL